MADVTVEKLKADSINTDELYTGNVLVTGAARFANGIQGDLKNSKDINAVPASTTINDNWTVLISDGTNIKRITFANLCTAIAAKIN